jgi:DNA-binding response OmpR family regulator
LATAKRAWSAGIGCYNVAFVRRVSTAAWDIAESAPGSAPMKSREDLIALPAFVSVASCAFKSAATAGPKIGQAEWAAVIFHPSSTRLAVHLHSAVCQCNYRAEMTVLNAGRFTALAMGRCPETHHGWECRRVPKRPAGFATSCQLFDCSPIGTISVNISSLARFESDKHSKAAMIPLGFLYTFALISLTSREREGKECSQASLINKPANPPERTKVMTNSYRERKRILMVDDVVDARGLAELILAEYTLISARSFDEGLRFAYLRYFDLYILDNWLPDGNGAELCRLIRAFDPNTPILFFSAAAYERDIQEALRSGAQGYLVKPVKSEELEQAVAKPTSHIARDSEAWRAEIAAVREELAIQYNEQARRMKSARDRHLRAEEKLMRLKAEKAFPDAGGTRGEFARRWPSVLTEEVRNPRTSDAASGH